jgi:uncharacterized protein (DUF1778 family)
MNLSESIQQHVVKLPTYLQAEVYDFVLSLEQRQQQPAQVLNSEVIELSVVQQEKFVQALLNPTSANAKLLQSAKNYQQKAHG